MCSERFIPFCPVLRTALNNNLLRLKSVEYCAQLQGMGLWTLLEGFLLLANALAIINEDRFLAPKGWSFSEFSVGRTKSLKGQIIGLIYATQYLRVPLMLLNTICIVVKLDLQNWISKVGVCEKVFAEGQDTFHFQDSTDSF
ncbi:hypothetical protein JRO89_XS06G0150900 [Xanthoceras sorbifolium]|uniref:Immediate early response 3-interacting protein 1 n=1 Tax=Xanthoceras sorbifolium TaxID=99658 RepID=A0ABQ8HYD3_9ROSI|nr:hypothetical protein JRO89_XS06G0150900 [Xanthoceras sorbifolium]